METNEKVVKPFLKWPGAKTLISSKIIEEIQRFQPRSIIEPFAGSSAVAFNHFCKQICDTGYLLSDVNADLISVYSFLKEEGGSFIADCRVMFNDENNTEAKYYKLREEFNKTKDIRRKAVIFIYLNRHGYNGLCRYNNQGLYNVPFGRYAKPYFPCKEMQQFYKFLRLAKIKSSTFLDTLSKATKGDVVYCDPPYLPLETGQSNFTNYATGGFNIHEQEVLASSAEMLQEKGIPVIISNHDTVTARSLYRRARIISFDVKRTISCNSASRKPVKEILAIFQPEA